jgi:hypothetical protein
MTKLSQDSNVEQEASQSPSTCQLGQSEVDSPLVVFRRNA